MKYIGQSVRRVDALEKVKGEAIFASDMRLPGQAYLKMLMAHRPHAIVSLARTPCLVERAHQTAERSGGAFYANQGAEYIEGHGFDRHREIHAHERCVFWASDGQPA